MLGGGGESEISRHTHFYNLFYFKFCFLRGWLLKQTAEDCFNNKAIYTMKTLFFFALFFSSLFVLICIS